MGNCACRKEEIGMQCKCGAGTRDKTSNKLDKEKGVRVIIEWSECTSCGRVLITKKKEEKSDEQSVQSETQRQI